MQDFIVPKHPCKYGIYSGDARALLVLCANGDRWDNMERNMTRDGARKITVRQSCRGCVCFLSVQGR